MEIHCDLKINLDGLIDAVHGRTIALMQELIDDMPDIEVLGADYFLERMDYIKERISIVDETIKANQH